MASPSSQDRDRFGPDDASLSQICGRIAAHSRILLSANELESSIANVRELLAETRTAMGDHEGAERERERARRLYESYGAAAYSDRILGLIDIAVGVRL